LTFEDEGDGAATHSAGAETHDLTREPSEPPVDLHTSNRQPVRGLKRKRQSNAVEVISLDDSQSQLECVVELTDSPVHVPDSPAPAGDAPERIQHTPTKLHRAKRPRPDTAAVG
ncbi:hypothetical protein EC988_007196, partial [Linderina pennispora]